MAVEFTVWAVPKGTDTSSMPFEGMDEAEIVFDERRPGIEFYQLLEYVRAATGSVDDYVLVPEDCLVLLNKYIETLNPSKDYVLSCV